MPVLDKKMILILVAVGVLLLFVTGFSIKKLFAGRKSALAKELKKEKQEIKAEKKIIDTKLAQSDYFNPATLGKYATDLQLPGETANKLAKKLKYELVWWGGRPSKMNGYFASLSHIVQVAQLAKLYALLYNRSLTTDISKYMTKGQVQDLYNVISKLSK